METEFETTSIEFDAETGLGRLTLDRPGVLNAIDDRLRADVVAGLRELASVDDADGIALRAVVLEGAGGNFCAGADIPALSDRPRGERSGRLPYGLIREYPVPVIAAVEGYCLGGGFELALSCDFRIAHEDARFGLPEVDVGAFPGVGGIQLGRDLANGASAAELAATGDYVDATRARDLNLVTRVHGEGFDDAVAAFAETIASKPPLAIRAIKRSATVAAETGRETGIEYDRRQVGRLRRTVDHEEAVREFVGSEDEGTFEER